MVSLEGCSLRAKSEFGKKPKYGKTTRAAGMVKTRDPSHPFTLNETQLQAGEVCCRKNKLRNTNETLSEMGALT